eukprot:Gregarina_sp_Poly_1__9211@NODE_567_length_7507_cov_202_306317_g445_i0_p6_GENE_NODE_567_length_7507_cov_202_306317_g445_i0NODE_567_length_7507_cov_202_306317_g445_i0_p6_ORF_typecomplete_len156_score7_10GIT_SHD/PF08518_11/0_69_NODE_567_length_7507_cov_202_306317_g445_i029573424
MRSTTVGAQTEIYAIKAQLTNGAPRKCWMPSQMTMTGAPIQLLKMQLLKTQTRMMMPGAPMHLFETKTRMIIWGLFEPMKTSVFLIISVFLTRLTIMAGTRLLMTPVKLARTLVTQKMRTEVKLMIGALEEMRMGNPPRMRLQTLSNHQFPANAY